MKVSCINNVHKIVIAVQRDHEVSNYLTEKKC